MMAETIEVRDEGDLRKYYSQIPHLIDDADISVYAYRLYGHIKRVCGQNGKCVQSTATMAKHCHMAMGSVKKAKGELAALGFIKIVVKKGGHGEFDQHIITVTDVWSENMAKYSTCSPGEQEHSPHEQDRSCSEQDRSPGELKNNLIKNNSIKKKESAAKPAAPRPPKPPKETDPLLENAAVMAYRGIAKATPNQQQRQLIADSVTDVQAWEAAINHWMLHGWNKLNVQGIIDSYKSGGASTCNLCKRKGGRVVAPAPDEAPAGFKLWHAGDPL